MRGRWRRRAASTPRDENPDHGFSGGQTLANTKADEIAQLGWRELDAYGDRTEQIHSPSGRIFRVTSRVYWDMESWASGINISVKARPDAGLRRLWR